MVRNGAWRGARSVDRINKVRIKANKAVFKFVIRGGGWVVRHCELKVVLVFTLGVMEYI